MKNSIRKFTGTFIVVLTIIFINISCNRMAHDKVLLPVKDDPTVSFRIWFKVGSQDDPKGKEGLAAITSMMLTEGATQTNSYEDILSKLYPIASFYSSKVDKEMTVVYGRTHKDNIEEYYKLFTEAILKPKFEQKDLDRLKSNMTNYIDKELRYSSDEELGKTVLNNFIFEGTPYGHFVSGTLESLKSITIDDIKEFYKNHYCRENVVVGLGGGYEEKLAKQLENDLCNLPEFKGKPVEKPQTSKIDGLEVRIIEKDANATAISFGFPISLLRNDEDFPALWVFNSWFGEHRNQSSHLYQVIREKRGMNYGDYSYIEPFLNGGQRNMPEPNNPRRQQIFEVWLRPVQHQHGHFALRAAVRELKKVVDAGMTKEDFEITKKFLYNYTLFYAQTTMDRLGYQIDSKFYGVKDDGKYIDYLRNKIKNLTLEEVNKAIKKHLQYQNIKIAIITKDAEASKNALINDSPSPVTYTSPVGDAVLQEDKEIEIFPMKVKTEKIKVIKVEDLFNK